jgi:hypothetical protein
MKKKRALLLSGSITLAILGYGAWCGRAFYLSVPVPELIEAPAECRADVQELLEKYQLTRPEPFGWKLFLRFLTKPYNSRPCAIRVEDLTPGPTTGFHLMLLLRRDRCHGWWGPDLSVFVIGRRGKWKIDVNDGPTVVESRSFKPASL